MFKQFLSKLPKKSSKSGENRGPGGGCNAFCKSSINSRGGELGSSMLSGLNSTLGSIPNHVPERGYGNGNKSGGSIAKWNGNSVSSAYEALPGFKDVPSSEKQNLFLRKLSMCCVVFDFTDATKNQREKEIKWQTMLELVDYVTSASTKFSEAVMQEVTRMVSVNLFRTWTPQPRENKAIEAFDLEEEEPSMDPAWPHLQIVYEFFFRFLASTETDAKTAKKYIDHSFILRLLELFDSEDPREREYLKTILHRIYGKFMVHRPFIRKAINNIFYRFIFETEKHNGIAELLEILGSIINGFALPLKEEHKLFLIRALIPLHKPKCLAMYHQQLSYCIIQFVEKDCKLADTVIRGLLKFWPVTNSSKEVMFLNELEEVLEATQSPEFQRCMVPLFCQIARCLSSSHFQITIAGIELPESQISLPYTDQGHPLMVLECMLGDMFKMNSFSASVRALLEHFAGHKVAERALFLWNNDHIENLIKQNRKVILPIIFSSLEKNTRSHWNQAVLSLTLNVRKIFFDLDPELFKECLAEFEEGESKGEGVRTRREAIWKQLEELAAKRVASNEPVHVPARISLCAASG